MAALYCSHNSLAELTVDSLFQTWSQQTHWCWRGPGPSCRGTPPGWPSACRTFGRAASSSHSVHTCWTPASARCEGGKKNDTRGGRRITRCDKKRGEKPWEGQAGGSTEGWKTINGGRSESKVKRGESSRGEKKWVRWIMERGNDGEAEKNEGQHQGQAYPLPCRSEAAQKSDRGLMQAEWVFC